MGGEDEWKIPGDDTADVVTINTVDAADTTVFDAFTITTPELAKNGVVSNADNIFLTAPDTNASSTKSANPDATTKIAASAAAVAGAIAIVTTATSVNVVISIVVAVDIAVVVIAIDVATFIATKIVIFVFVIVFVVNIDVDTLAFESATDMALDSNLAKLDNLPNADAPAIFTTVDNAAAELFE